MYIGDVPSFDEKFALRYVLIILITCTNICSTISIVSTLYLHISKKQIDIATSVNH